MYSCQAIKLSGSIKLEREGLEDGARGKGFKVLM